MPLEERDMQQQEVEQEEVLGRRRWRCSCQHGRDSRNRAVGGWGLGCYGEEEQEEMI